MTTTITQIVHHDEVTEIEVTEIARYWEPGGIAVKYVDAQGTEYWRTEKSVQSHR